MKFSLVQMARRATNPRRRQITLRPIIAPGTMATNLFRTAYLPVIQAWEQGLARILAEYGRTVSSMTTDAPADVERAVTSIGDEISRLLLVLTPRLRDWALRVEKFHRGKWRGAVLSAARVDLETMIGQMDVAETLETVISRNVALVRDVSAQAQGRISDAVFRGLTNRTPARDVAKDVREAVAMSRRRSINIASDQLTKLTSALDGERMRQAGIEKWEWKSSHKLHFRPEHQARDGKIYSFDDPPAEMPGELPFCGCRKLAVVEFD